MDYNKETRFDVFLDKEGHPIKSRIYPSKYPNLNEIIDLLNIKSSEKTSNNPIKLENMSLNSGSIKRKTSSNNIDHYSPKIRF